MRPSCAEQLQSTAPTIPLHLPVWHSAVHSSGRAYLQFKRLGAVMILCSGQTKEPHMRLCPDRGLCLLVNQLSSLHWCLRSSLSTLSSCSVLSELPSSLCFTPVALTTPFLAMLRSTFYPSSWTHSVFLVGCTAGHGWETFKSL
jgi:hypothetical protein